MMKYGLFVLGVMLFTGLSWYGIERLTAMPPSAEIIGGMCYGIVLGFTLTYAANKAHIL